MPAAEERVPTWVLLAVVLVGGILLALIRVAFGTKPKSRKRAGRRQAQPAATKPAARQLRGYTAAEVARHASEKDLWLIIRDRTTGRANVYDVTEYIEEHPGGDAIFTHAGGDATEGFHGPQHPATVHDLVREYLIGHLVEDGQLAATRDKDA